MLEKYLMEKFNISTLEKLNCNIRDDKFTVAKLIQVIKDRKTEQNVIDIIEKFKLSSKADVVSYLSGMIDRFVIENVI